MSTGLTGAVGGADNLSRSNEAIIFGTGTPSHDMFARSRFFPGPQHGRWRCGLSTNRLLVESSNALSAARHTYRDGVVGSVYEFEDAAWTDASKTITSTGAFAGLTWNDNMVVVIKSGTGWVPGIYKVATVASDDAITLADPIDADFSEVSGKWPGANNTDTLGYLCIGFYAEVFTPIGAPTGVSGSSNQFNLPGTTSTDSFAFKQSKYWDYVTSWLPPGGLGGGAEFKIKLAGRFKLADLGVHPFDSLGANAPGAYDTEGKVRVCIVVDPWSSVFASIGPNHNDLDFRSQQRTLLGWNPVDGPRENTWELNGIDLRLLGGSPGNAFAGDAQAVYFSRFDAEDADFPDIEPGQTYWVDALAGANLGKYLLHLDKSLATVVTSATIDGNAVASVGAVGSLYALRFYFDIHARTTYMRNADATAATDQISHLSLESRVVGDALTCIQADGSGLSSNTPVTLSAVTATAATDRISEAALSSRSVGDALLCLEAGASGLTVGVTYYIKTKPTATTAELSLTPGGALFDITSDETDLSFLYSNVYYIVSKPTPTTATLSLSRIGGSVFNIATDADEVSFSYTNPNALDMEQHGHVEAVITMTADGSSDNFESGIRATAQLRITPFTDQIGGIAFAGRTDGDFAEYQSALSRTFPGQSNSDVAISEAAVGAPAVMAKRVYYNDGSNDFAAFYSTRFDYGGDWDILHLNGEVLRSGAPISGEYDYPLESIQGTQAHGLSSNNRRATKTYVFRNAETTPIGEVVLYDQARRILAVRGLLEDERIKQSDTLTLKTYRYVRVTTVSGLVWDPALKTLTGTNAFTNLNLVESPSIALLAASNNDALYLRSHLPDFTPGFFAISTKDSNSQITLTSGTGLPTYATSATSVTFSGYYVRPAGSSWDFEMTPIQSLQYVSGPRFTRGNYVGGTGVMTLDTADLAGWTWYSGARVWITQGTGFTVPAYYTITSATSTTITITGGPGGNATNVIGQLETNTPITVDMVDAGPQVIPLAVRIAVTGPPSGDCELEINTYHAELIDAGSR